MPKNHSKEIKQLCFCCYQDQTWIKMPILWKHFSTTECLWRTFWRNIWRCVFDFLKILGYYVFFWDCLSKLEGITMSQNHCSCFIFKKGFGNSMKLAWPWANNKKKIWWTVNWFVNNNWPFRRKFPWWIFSINLFLLIFNW